MNTKNILAIGAGPSGLSLSALATTCSENSVTLLEARPNFEWHSGMMLRNPTGILSEFSSVSRFFAPEIGID